MSRQVLIVILAGVALFTVVLTATLVFTGGGSGGGNVHTMNNGQTMTGSMGGSGQGGMADMSDMSP